MITVRVSLLLDLEIENTQIRTD